MKKIIFIICILLLFFFMGCSGANPLIGQKYEGGDALMEKEYSVTFNNDKYCTISCTWNSSNGITEDLIYKLGNEENDMFGSISGKLFWAENKEYYGELTYAKDGSWISIQSKENYINSKRLRKVN